LPGRRAGFTPRAGFAGSQLGPPPSSMPGSLPVNVRRRGLALRTRVRVMAVSSFVGACGAVPARDSRRDFLTIPGPSTHHKGVCDRFVGSEVRPRRPANRCRLLLILCQIPMVNRTGISASNAGACIGSLVVFLRGAVIQPVHIELVLAETHPGCGWKNRRTDSRRT